jgi:HEAT repeat protein
MAIKVQHVLVVAAVVVAGYFAFKHFAPVADRDLAELLESYPKEEGLKASVVEKALLRQCYRNREAIPELLKGMRNRNEQIRALAARGLGETWAYRDEKVVVALLQGLKDKQDVVRESAAKAFRNVRVVNAIVPLIGALEDESEGVRTQAHKALKRITEEDWKADKKAWSEWWREDQKKFYVKRTYSEEEQ